MSNTVIHIENVSKLYRLGLVSTRSLAHDVNRWWYRVRGREDPYLKIGQSNQRDSKSMAEYVWALKDVNLEVEQGEVLGIIGKNGAGKSTLLKILARITNPTTGQINVRGRIASLLEVGTGFHPELTGRENIFLNGAILGMRKHEIQKRFDEIVDFSGCDLYIDTPVKRYSSGMYVRLAFAVAAHLDPEILIFDEVLAVGDAQFQKKSLGKMHDVAGQGRTVLFVSHNMTAVQTLCNKAMLLVDGMQTQIGGAAAVVTNYLQTSFNVHPRSHWDDSDAAPGDDVIRLSILNVENGDEPESRILAMHQSIRIMIRYRVAVGGRKTHIALQLMSDHGISVLTTSSSSRVKDVGEYEEECLIPSHLLNSGGYMINLRIVHDGATVTCLKEEIAAFNVVESKEREEGYLQREPCVVLPRLPWTSKSIGIGSPIPMTNEVQVV